MFFKTCFWLIILFTVFSQIPYTFSGEVYRWTDEKGTIHFTDDVSKIPKPYSDQAERIEVQEETLKEVEKIGKPDHGGHAAGGSRCPGRPSGVARHR